MWLRLLTFYFRSPKGSHKIFLGSSLAFFQSLSQRSWVLLEIYNSVPVKQVDVRPLYMLWVTSSGKSPLTHTLDGCRQRLISLNWGVLLHNIKYLCPPMAIYIRNCYSVPSRLFVLGGTEISSSEGTTQGDPLAMPVYAIGITPLLETIKPESPKHVAFADDLGGAGELLELRHWWDNIVL